MNIKIIAVGKIKEEYFKSAIKDYIKRLSPYFQISVKEVNAEQIIDESRKEKYKEKEAEKILSLIKTNAYLITLEIQGEMLSSIEFAQKIQQISKTGVNEIIFVIGGANRIHKKVSDIADYKLSFSKLTFTHQMARVILAEQIYRVAKINAGENYHR